MLVTYALTTSIVFIAFLGQAIFGFGGGILSIPLLSLLMPIQDSVCIVLIFQTLMGLLLYSNRQNIPWKTIRPLGLGIIIGSSIGTLTLGYANEFYLRVFLILFIIAFLLRSWFFASVSFPEIKKPVWATITGGIGGFVQGVLGTGGPIFVVYLNETEGQQNKFRAAIIFILFACNLVRLTLAAPTGLLSNTVWSISLLALPAFLLALALGQYLHVKIKKEAYRACVQLLLLVSVFALVLKLAN